MKTTTDILPLPSPYQEPSLPHVTAQSILTQLEDLFAEIVKRMGATLPGPFVMVSEKPDHGDFASNIALRLTKQLKIPPMDIALQVKEMLDSQKIGLKGEESHQKASNNNLKTSVDLSRKSVLQDILEVKIAAPGFVNLSLADRSVSTRIARLISSEEAVLTIQNPIGAGKRVVLEFTDPNPFKELHIGHLYSNTVGESLARLLSASLFTVRRVCYQGDVGLHVAKAVWGMDTLLVQASKATSVAEIATSLKDKEAESLSERAKWLGKAYALGSQAYEENKDIAEKIKAINYGIFVCAQAYLVKEKEWKPQVDYKQYLPDAPLDLDRIGLLYTTGRKWSLDYFDSIYNRLGMTFDGYYFESVAGEYGAKLVQNQTPAFFTVHENATIFQGERYGLHTRVFINALGLPTYEAKELGLAPTKAADWLYDYSLILTGKEINEYFTVLLTAMACINPELANRTKHLSHGMVRLPEGKMSSRTGNVLAGEWLIEVIKSYIYEIVQNNISKGNNKQNNDTLGKNKISSESFDAAEVSEKAAIAALKYSFLKVGLPADITFDLQASISFEGESGPYLQYTYARCKSVLRKAGTIHLKKLEQLSYLEKEERALSLLLLRFSDVVAEATNTLSPNILCTYLFELAQLFNVVYAKYPIKDNQFRLSLTQGTAWILAKGLYLLGIETMERM